MFRVFTSHLTSPAVFEEAGELGIFSVPEHKKKLGIFPCPRVYMEETVRRVIPRTLALLGASPSGCIRRRKKLGIFLSTRTYREGERSKFLQVPESRRKVGIFT